MHGITVRLGNVDQRLAAGFDRIRIVVGSYDGWLYGWEKDGAPGDSASSSGSGGAGSGAAGAAG